MARVSMGVDLSTLINALIEGNTAKLIAVSRDYLREEQVQLDVLLGRIGMIAVHGDSDGHPTITLAAAAMLSRLLHTIPAPVDSDIALYERALPLFIQSLRFAAPAVQRGRGIQPRYPDPLFPSELPEGKLVNDAMYTAIYNDDPLQVERLLFGLYGSGADYRTLEVRTFEGISATFQNAGHPLMFALRGFQLLDTVEWGDRAPNVIHWLSPRLPLRSGADEPSWVPAVRTFIADPTYALESIRTRLSLPRDENALPLRQLLTEKADAVRICQGVYDALIPGGASPRAVASVIALAAADIVRQVSDGDRDLFIRAAHGLLFSAAVSQVFRRVQDIEVLGLLFTSAVYINALHEEISAIESQPAAAAAPGLVGGGMIAASQLENLEDQLKAQDLAGALSTARRYVRLGHDPRALFAVIGLAAALTDMSGDQGHTLQIVQAAGEEFMAWPRTLAKVDIESFLLAALRAAAFGKRDTLASQL
jgi:hypothetical protein